MHQLIMTANLDSLSSYYLNLLPNHNYEELLQKTRDSIIQRFRQIDKQQQDLPYATGKWSPRQVLMHLIDVEQIFGYRITRIAREEGVQLMGFNPDQFSDFYRMDQTSFDQLLHLYELQRQFSYDTIMRLTSGELAKYGHVDQVMIQAITLVLRIPAHDIHHLQIIEKHYATHHQNDPATSI